MFEEIKEVAKALTLIQKVCKDHPDCDDTCPFCKGDYCALRERSPEDWNIDTNPKITWKAFE